MKKPILAALLPALFASCVAPINTSYESARMLGKGNVEVMGNYTHYTVSSEGESDGINDNFGVRLGYGFNDRFDLKLRYEHLIPTEEEEEVGGVNYLDIAPKFQIMPKYIAGTLPVGWYFYEADGESESEFVISPKLLFTYPPNDKFEVTLATKADIFPEGEGNVYLGFNLGFGVSSDLNRWAVRPELGLMIDPGESGVYWAYGIGVVGVLPGKSNK